MTLRDRQSTRALNTNSKAWKILRQQVLVRDGYQCRACRRIVTGREAHVDHINNDASDPESNKLEFLQVLCVSCHSSKSVIEMRGDEWEGKPAGPVGCDEDGWPL